METDRIKIHLIRWDEDILSEVSFEDNGLERGKKTAKAYYGKAVSRLTGAFASVLFFDGHEPERLVSHYGSGKPYMVGYEDITVSISHCGNAAAVSLSDVCHGIDIERPRALGDSIMRHVFSKEEKNTYSGLSSEKERSGFFFTCWTRKEALIKTGAITLGGMTGVRADRECELLGGHVYWWDTVRYGELYLSLCCRDIHRYIDTVEESRETQLTVLRYLRELS